MSESKDFHTIMDDILKDYLGLDYPSSDVSNESIPFIIASVMASQPEESN